MHGISEGGLWGSIVGFVVIIAIPGLGAVSGAGRWFEVLGGIVLGAAVGGALFFLRSLTIAEPVARFYARELEMGHFIVTVNSPRAKEAADVLQHHGAQTGPAPVMK